MRNCFVALPPSHPAQDCYKLQQHPHPLKAIPVRPAAQQQKQLSPAQREERQRHIKLHMQLLQHASTCEDRKCQSKNCSRMKVGVFFFFGSCNVVVDCTCALLDPCRALVPPSSSSSGFVGRLERVPEARAASVVLSCFRLVLVHVSVHLKFYGFYVRFVLFCLGV